MPLHPHECATCGPFEVLTVRVSTDPDPTCPGCGARAERRYGVPHLVTDTQFLAGCKLGGDQFADNELGRMEAQAARESGAPVKGRAYVPGLARFPMDPEAFVDSRADIKKILLKRGWGSPDLGVKPQVFDPVKAPPLAPDVMDRYVARYLKGVKKKDRTPQMVAETREMVAARHGPQPDDTAHVKPAWERRRRPKGRKPKAAKAQAT